MRDNATPRISVITATLNAGEKLEHLFRSLEAQDFRAFEWVVVDGCSVDGTVERLGRLAKENSWIRFISEPDCGLYDAINKGIRLVRGERYVVAGADDMFDPRALGLFHEAADRSKADVVIARVWVNGALSGRYSPAMRWISPSFVFRGSHSVGMLFSVGLHERFGYYSRQYLLLADSYFLKTLLLSGRVCFKPVDFVAGKFGSGGLTGRNPLQSLIETWLIQMRSERFPGFQTLLFFAKLLWRFPRIRAELRSAKPNCTAWRDN